MRYDVAVIGAGLFGSATAKYLQKNGRNTVLIGPTEPVEDEFGTSKVYASHYDHGRVTRKIGKTAEWTALNVLSQKAFESIVAESGINFYGDEGCLYISDIQPDLHLNLLRKGQLIEPDQAVHQWIQPEQLKEIYPYLNIHKPIEGYIEHGQSGHLNPRKLLEAQKIILKKEGGCIISEIAEKVQSVEDYFQILTEKSTFEAKKVIYATGVFHNFFDFGTARMPLKIKTETVILGEVDRATFEEMQRMPSLLYTCIEEDYDEIYLIKPLLYPDGKYYLKMGANLKDDRYIQTLAEVQEWFRRSNLPNQKTILKRILNQLFPNIVFHSYQIKHCIIEYTENGRPMIEAVGAHQYVAIGGNGYGAMCSDGVGQKMCQLILNQ